MIRLFVGKFEPTCFWNSILTLCSEGLLLLPVAHHGRHVVHWIDAARAINLAAVAITNVSSLNWTHHTVGIAHGVNVAVYVIVLGWGIVSVPGVCPLLLFVSGVVRIQHFKRESYLSLIIYNKTASPQTCVNHTTNASNATLIQISSNRQIK